MKKIIPSTNLKLKHSYRSINTHIVMYFVFLILQAHVEKLLSLLPITKGIAAPGKHTIVEEVCAQMQEDYSAHLLLFQDSTYLEEEAQKQQRTKGALIKEVCTKVMVMMI